MRLSQSVLFSLAALLALATCHGDVTCVYDSDCASQGTGYVCVPDSSGWGHCLTAADVFGVEQDGGTATASNGDAGSQPPVDAGIDAGVDAGPTVDAGIDAGSQDAGEDAGFDAGVADAGGDGGMDAGSSEDAGPDGGAADAGGHSDGGPDAGDGG